MTEATLMATTPSSSSGVAIVAEGVFTCHGKWKGSGALGPPRLVTCRTPGNATHVINSPSTSNEEIGRI